MAYYRSDWPEVGLKAPLSGERESISDKNAEETGGWIQKRQVSGAVLQWIASENEFESRLYNFPIWEIRLVVDDPDRCLLNKRLDSDLLLETVNRETHRILSSPPWGDAYVSAKLVKGELLYKLFERLGFREVENRRLFSCKIKDLESDADSARFEGGIQFTSLSEVAVEQVAVYQKQILDICREAFKNGYTRHFSDSFLLERRPGLDYILAVMELNFKHVDPAHFLIAVDNNLSRVCGFSAIGQKSGLKGNIYTQLLSGVSKEYRGRGIYRGLTRLLSRTFPPDAGLLNVTHVANQKIQRAYKDSGRIHVADTVLLRRVFKEQENKQQFPGW